MSLQIVIQPTYGYETRIGFVWSVTLTIPIPFAAPTTAYCASSVPKPHTSLRGAHGSCRMVFVIHLSFFLCAHKLKGNLLDPL